jgi:ribosome-associated protein
MLVFNSGQWLGVGPGREYISLMMFQNKHIDERLISEEFIRASGPGGQNVNKVETAVKLFFDLEGSSFAAEVKARLRALAGSRINSQGLLVIDARSRRTREENREEARRRLDRMISLALIKPKTRRPTKPSRAARIARMESKKRRGSVKEMRRKDIRND